MDVRTGSKSWGYSKRPRNWKKIMYKEIGQGLESEARIPEIEEIPEIDESHESEARIPEIEEIEESHESEARIDKSLESEASIEKPKITARVSNPTSLTLPVTLVDPALPATLVDPALPATLVDSSFSYI